MAVIATIILNMQFKENNIPNIGSIKFDRRKEHLHLLTADIPKLNSILTKSICEGTYNVPEFYFESGDVAFVDDTQRAFVYNADSDTWTEWDI